MNEFAQKVLDLAQTQVGVREHGRNTGPEIVGYCRDIGWPEHGIRPEKGPDPWCAIFVSSMCKRAAIATGLGLQLHLTAGVSTLDERAPPACRRSTPVDGSIFILDGHKHTGFVLRADAEDADLLYTIEGNTDPGGSVEGDGVYARTRRQGEIMTYLDLSELAP